MDRSNFLESSEESYFKIIPAVCDKFTIQTDIGRIFGDYTGIGARFENVKAFSNSSSTWQKVVLAWVHIFAIFSNRLSNAPEYLLIPGHGSKCST